MPTNRSPNKFLNNQTDTPRKVLQNYIANMSWTRRHDYSTSKSHRDRGHLRHAQDYGSTAPTSDPVKVINRLYEGYDKLSPNYIQLARILSDQSRLAIPQETEVIRIIAIQGGSLETADLTPEAAMSVFLHVGTIFHEMENRQTLDTEDLDTTPAIVREIHTAEMELDHNMATGRAGKKLKQFSERALAAVVNERWTTRPRRTLE
ncbi:hypothetical protein K432DRAFT_390838 [Lepidopterella palustris CBS 459.81]|uniref:Uncharacterized protein n=1 Tax=Lepidopterella palustris CBS 459.81 TaxID=1314670 RepID=A0A8E2EFM1_9PEZI|nr:hypothetical protein K432DRAFT_390838 [Lepidopterella palustris CBS 459.81]